MNEPRITGTVVRAADREWRALAVPGVSVKLLRHDKATGDGTALIKFAAGVRFPAHDHPGGEQVYLLEGDLTIGPDTLKPGDYHHTPPNGKHAASSVGGCVFLVSTPKPVVILE